MNKHLILSLSAFCALSLHAQPTLQWQRCLGGTDIEEAYCSKQTPDGGFIVAGHARSLNGDVSGNHGAYDAWLVKFDQAGQIQWKRCYGGSGNEWCQSVALTSDGGYVFTGLVGSSDGDVTFGYHGGGDAWVVKTDSDGKIQWQRCLGGTKLDMGECVQQTTDGGYIVLCRSESKDGQVSGNHGGVDFWAVKLNPNGQVVWQRSYGGSWFDFPQFIRQTSDGGYVMTGFVNSIDGDIQGETYGDDDYWVVKLSPTGSIEWERTLGGSSDDLSYEVIQAIDGGYVVIGTSGSKDWDKTAYYGSYDVWLVKLSPSGTIVWEKTLGGSGEDRGASVLETADGSLYIAGSTASNDLDVSSNIGSLDYWIARLNSSGAVMWEKTFGGSSYDFATSLNLCADGGFFIAGYSYSNDGDVSGNHSPNTTDYWVVKLSPEPVGTSAPAPAPLQISPNPAAEGRARVQAGGTPGERLWLTLCDMTGRPLKEQWGTDDGDIDLSGLPPGTYLIRAVAEDGAVRAGTLVKL